MDDNFEKDAKDVVNELSPTLRMLALVEENERLRAENERLRTMHERVMGELDEIADTVPGDEAGPHFGAAEWHKKVLEENERLRAALIQTGRTVGARLADNVSSEFLTKVPAEVKAVLGKFRHLRDLLVGDYESAIVDPTGPKRGGEGELRMTVSHVHSLLMSIYSAMAAVRQKEEQ